MRVINMAHGEMLMMGGYLTYISVSIFGKSAGFAIGLVVAFIGTALFGALLEITLIRRLYGRPLDTLLGNVGRQPHLAASRAQHLRTGRRRSHGAAVVERRALARRYRDDGLVDSGRARVHHRARGARARRRGLDHRPFAPGPARARRACQSSDRRSARHEHTRRRSGRVRARNRDRGPGRIGACR